MTLTTKIVRQYQCCGQVMPVPVVIKRLANYRRPMPICQQSYLPPYPQPPYQQPPYQQPQYPPQQYQQPQYPPQQYPQHQYQQPQSSHLQPYSFQQQSYPQPPQYYPHHQQQYQQYQPPQPQQQQQPQQLQPQQQIQIPSTYNTYPEAASSENQVIQEIQTQSIDDNKKESDSNYRIPPSYPIVEYSSDITVLPGNIVIQTTDTVPDGYLLCDGTDVSREIESTLFNVIGTFYGEGNGSTTFCLPDLEDEEQPTRHYMIKR